jgi:hypothetical protein
VAYVELNVSTLKTQELIQANAPVFIKTLGVIAVVIAIFGRGHGKEKIKAAYTVRTLNGIEKRVEYCGPVEDVTSVIPNGASGCLHEDGRAEMEHTWASIGEGAGAASFRRY